MEDKSIRGEIFERLSYDLFIVIPGDRNRTNGRTLIGVKLWFKRKKTYLPFIIKAGQKSLVSQLEFKRR